MTHVISALTARTQLGQILRRVKAKNERFVVDRRGEAEAVIMSMKDYVDLVAPEPDWLRRVGEASKRRGTSKLTMRQINTEIRASRRETRAKGRVG
jgi:prevent-host-death family protein